MRYTTTNQEISMIDSEIAAFAARFSLDAKTSVVLPALFERTATETNMPVRALVSQATYSNKELGEYLAETAKVVASQYWEAA